jgi:hypothetical protein
MNTIKQLTTEEIMEMRYTKSLTPYLENVLLTDIEPNDTKGIQRLKGIFHFVKTDEIVEFLKSNPIPYQTYFFLSEYFDLSSKKDNNSYVPILGRENFVFYVPQRGAKKELYHTDLSVIRIVNSK